MNRIKYLATLVAFTIALLVIAAAVSHPADASSSRPKYATPTNVVPFSSGETAGEVVWRTVKYADFYTVDVSTSKSMSHAQHLVTYSTDINAMDLQDLRPDTRYYVTVEVSSSRGESLSSDSKVSSFRTDRP